MKYNVGDFVKAQNTKDKRRYSYARIRAYNKDSDSYTIDDIYTTEDRELLGTIEATLENSETYILYKVDKEQVFAEMI